MKLHAITQGKNRYCGPGAVAAIAGCTTDVAAALIRRRFGRAFVKGSHHEEMRFALDMLGYTVTEEPVRCVDGQLRVMPSRARPTMAAWARSTFATRGAAVHLLCIGNHYAVVQARRYVCSQTREIVPLSKAPNRRALVRRVWTVSKTHEPRTGYHLVIEAQQRKAVRNAGESSARRELRKLLKKYPDVVVDESDRRSFGHIWVTCKLFDEDESQDPFEGDHIVDDISDALARAREYVQHLTSQENAA